MSTCLFVLLQWTQEQSVPLRDIDDVCQSAIHRGWLYIITGSRPAGVVAHRTRNKRDWETLPFPPNTKYCNGILSHNDRLFILSQPPRSVDRNQHLNLHELLEVDGRLKWRALQNGRCPVQRWDPAFFGIGNSLVLAGGDSTTLPWPIECSEYNLHGNYWVETTNWPALPKQTTSLKAVVVGDCVHLIGGRNTKYSLTTDVFSVCVKNCRAVGAWFTDVVPPTPGAGCGACHVHGNLVVAGGVCNSPGVFVYDEESHAWLQLPKLTIGRCSPALVHFGHSVLAVGGVGHHNSYINEVEKLSLAAF